MNDFASLNFPSPWPPPEFAEPTVSQWLASLFRIPVLGRMVHYGWHWHHRHRFINDILMPIERQIVEQLKARSGGGFWPVDSMEAILARLLGESVAAERGLPRVLVHPDDPLELLCWGAEEDLLRLQFSIQVQKAYDIHVDHKEWWHLAENHQTVSDLIALCQAKHADPERQNRRARSRVLGWMGLSFVILGLVTLLVGMLSFHQLLGWSGDVFGRSSNLVAWAGVVICGLGWMLSLFSPHDRPGRAAYWLGAPIAYIGFVWAFATR